MAADEKPSEFRWRDADLDNALLQELASKSPSEERIRELVRQGADVNSVKNDQSVMTDVLSLVDHGLDQRFVRLLVELGADTNWLGEEGNSALFMACLTQKPELVEYVLQHGADPNVIIDFNESLLDLAEFDQWVHETEANGGPPDSNDAVSAKAMADIVALLKRYGAKPMEDLEAREIGGWLVVFAAYRTGLQTAKGNVVVERMPGATPAFCQEFRGWVASHWDSWPHRDWSTMPKGFDREAHSAHGRELAGHLKRLLGDGVKVMYYCVCAESERKHVRNVNHESIA